MDAELKQKWVEALRSGKYKQGRFCLRDNENCHCCLGVLCDLIDPNGWDRHLEDWDNEDDFERFKWGKGSEWSTEEVPDQVADRVRLGHQSQLMDMNDQGKTFAEIADWIEKVL